MPPEPLHKQYVPMAIGALFVWMMLALFVSSCRADVPDEVGVRCIIGEGSSEGFDGLVALADALQNRGHIKGVFGCRAPHIAREPLSTWKMARRAWQRAKTANIVGGASFWGSLKVDKAWIKRMEKAGYTKTLTVKNTAFYRE